jgi:hypothetical protein
MQTILQIQSFNLFHSRFISGFADLAINMLPPGCGTCARFIIALHPTSSSSLNQRDIGEHVILANCIDNNGVQSSQMAYFSGSPGNSPNNVANVSSPLVPYGHTRVWEDGLTSALFDDGVTFTSNITAIVSQGDYAGPGKNDYGPFTCWSNYVANLYKWAANTCTEIYDCNHSAAPGSTVFLILIYVQ